LIHRAAEEGNLDIIKDLLDSGADIWLRDASGSAMAIGYAKENGHDEAASFLRTRMEAVYDQAKAHGIAGGERDAAGDREGALCEFRLAVEIFPEYEEGLYGLGDKLLDLGKVQESEHVIMKLISLQPDCAGAHNILGLIRRANGDMLGAIAAFEAALKCDPHSAHMLQAEGIRLAQANLGRARQRLAERTATPPGPATPVGTTDAGSARPTAPVKEKQQREAERTQPQQRPAKSTGCGSIVGLLLVVLPMLICAVGTVLTWR
jgi:tetratricopeptide (TPR) repeat protein